ncbi:MAG: chalcone isomerase family protein [Candidatus Levyibacteriota bacterium]
MAGRMVAMLLWLTMAVSGSAWALDIGGVHLDDKASVGGTELVLNGAGIRKKLFFKVYVGSLYLPGKASSTQDVLAQAPRRIQMNMLRSLTADQLVEALVDGLKDNTTEAERTAIKSQTDALVSIMKSFKEVSEGSVVSLDFVGGVTRVVLDGKERGEIGGDAFGRALTEIWLGEHPVQPDLKKAMLGGA